MTGNIYRYKNRYHLIKQVYTRKIHYGIYDNPEDAAKKRDLLTRNNWIKSQKTGYTPEESFPEYEIRKDEKRGYYITDNKDGKYGYYENIIYTLIIKKILPYYQDDVNIRRIEKQALREFYKYISYNRKTKRYYIKYKNTTLSTSKSKQEILEERDLNIKYNSDEELMCENHTPGHYKSIPEFKPKTDNIICRPKSQNRYRIQKQIKQEKIVVGDYPSYTLACIIRDFLNEKNWDKKTVQKIHKTTQKIQQRNKNIYLRKNKYSIEVMKNYKTINYGYYNSINLARYMRDQLKKNNWNRQLIDKFTGTYNKTIHKTRYYYDNTDFIKQITKK